jgi:hypothetical protein
MSVGVTVLGTAVDNDGYLSSLLDVGTPGSELTNGTFFTAWNVTLEGPAYNAGVLAKINDPQEFVKGGSQVGDPVTTGLQNLAGVCPEALGAYACNSIVGNGQLNINENIGPWVFASQDPLQLHSIPEPGSLALLGIALLGFVAAGRRRVA